MPASPFAPYTKEEVKEMHRNINKVMVGDARVVRLKVAIQDIAKILNVPLAGTSDYQIREFVDRVQTLVDEYPEILEVQFPGKEHKSSLEVTEDDEY